MENFLQDLMAGDKDAIVVVITAYFLLMTGWSLVQQIRTRAWPSTVGQLASLGTRKFGVAEVQPADQDYVNKAHYSYRVDGREYTGTRVSPWIIVASHNAKALLENELKGVNVSADGSVEVFYNPLKPHKAFLIKPGYFGMAFTAAIGALPLVYWV